MQGCHGYLPGPSAPLGDSLTRHLPPNLILATRLMEGLTWGLLYSNTAEMNHHIITVVVVVMIIVIVCYENHQIPLFL